MSLILKSMMSLVVLSNLALAASGEEPDLKALTLYKAPSPAEEGSRAHEAVRNRIASIMSEGGAAAPKIRKIQAALKEASVPLPVGFDWMGIFVRREKPETLFARLNIDVVAPQRRAALALTPAVNDAQPVLALPPAVSTKLALPVLMAPLLPAPLAAVAERVDELPQLPVAPAVRPKVLALGWMAKADQAEGVGGKRLALMGAQQLMLQSAEDAGRRQEVESRMVAVNAALKAADDHYQTLLAMVAVVKKDLKDFEVACLREWALQHEDEAAEVYVDGLVAYLAAQAAQGNPVAFVDREERGQIDTLKQLLTDARANIATARGELEAISRTTMLALQ